MVLTVEQLIENEKRIAALFLLNQLSSATVEFDGCDTDRKSYLKCESILKSDKITLEEDIPIQVWVRGNRYFDPSSNSIVNETAKECEISLYTALEQHVENLLHKYQIHWTDGDGHYGHWSWSDKDGIEFTIYQRIVDSDLIHYGEYTLGCLEQELASTYGEAA